MNATAPSVETAKAELLALAEVIHQTRRGASLPASYELARVQRPELAAVLDAHNVAPPSVVLMPERSNPRQSAHLELVAKAEEIRSTRPTLTKEAAYAAAWTAHPEIVAKLAEEQHREMRSINAAELGRIQTAFGTEGPGQQRGYNASPRPLTPTIPGDMAADPRHDGWTARARELVKAGRYPTVEQAYVAAMKGL
jgi:hypothetical protein